MKISIERCNEIISKFEDIIEEKYKKKYKYEGEERDLLIKKIQDNPDSYWYVTENGLAFFS